MTPEFRQGEREVHIHLTCTECGKSAEGNHSWTDGSGELCDKCVEEDDKACTCGRMSCENAACKEVALKRPCTCPPIESYYMSYDSQQAACEQARMCERHRH